MNKEFDNKERTRYYGLRKGDIVNLRGIDGRVMYEEAEVKEYGFMDNNRVYVEYQKDSETVIQTGWVAEWCEIVTKVEDRGKPEVINADLKNADFRWYYDTTQKRHYCVLGYFGGGAVNIADAYRLAQEYSEVCNVPLETVKIDEIMRSRRFKRFKYMYSSFIQEEVNTELVDLSDVMENVHKWLQD